MCLPKNYAISLNKSRQSSPAFWCPEHFNGILSFTFQQFGHFDLYAPEPVFGPE
jgi:hypothetical protein